MPQRLEKEASGVVYFLELSLTSSRYAFRLDLECQISLLGATIKAFSAFI
jgi:hypothetical protein